MYSVDTADQYLAYCPFIGKTVKWPKKVFFYLQCCLFNNYVTFSKNNPNSRKSFLDFVSDILFLLSFVLSCILKCVLQKFLSPFKSQFSAKYQLVPLSTQSLLFPYDHPVAA